MLSRWTNFYTEDGEKEWRKRDSEFEDTYTTKTEMIMAWKKGWTCLIDVVNSLKSEDLKRIIYIRNGGHTVLEAINRQLCHYSYHIGQLVYVGKLIKSNDWESLSIPKNQFSKYNKEQFDKGQHHRHFTYDI